MDGKQVRPYVRVARPLELGMIEVAVAVVALARELDAPTHRITLGQHGSFELDSAFRGRPLSETSRRGEQCIASRGRLWSPDGMTVQGVLLTIESGIAMPTEIALTAVATLAPTFADRMPEYLELADAAIAEVADELRYHAVAKKAAA